MKITDPIRHRVAWPWRRALVLLVLAATAGILSQTVLGGSKKVQIGTGSVSALARAARLGDRLPSSVLALAFAAHNFAQADGSGSRLLMTDGSLDLYAVPGKDRLVCLVEVDSATRTAGGSCADRNVLLTGSIYMADLRQDGTRDVVGLVGDGHTYAEANGSRTRIRENAFVLRGVNGNSLTIGSPAAAQKIDFGD